MKPLLYILTIALTAYVAPPALFWVWDNWSHFDPNVPEAWVLFGFVPGMLLTGIWIIWNRRRHPWPPKPTSGERRHELARRQKQYESLPPGAL